MAGDQALAEKQDFIKSAQKTKNENNGKGSTQSWCRSLWCALSNYLMVPTTVGYFVSHLLVMAV